ncbi:MAG: hypothetical protein KGI72_05300 [Patescibacteria group bacterium]|nr:hypothetical protein [Patescibacteria group bacterium]MDE2233077.1 hypothetical protein [Patescibacteria group bacterium]
MAEEKEDKYYNPFLNPDAIVIVKQADGNYKGWANRFGKVVEERQFDPLVVLQLLLTHPGK